MMTCTTRARFFWMMTLSLGSLLVIMAGSPAAAQERPNIILFVVDDMGWSDTSLQLHHEPTPGNRLYATPHMERLASRGICFTDGYSASPVCSPTRVSLMTGQNPARSHVSSWVGHDSPNQDNIHLIAPDWADQGLQPGGDQVMLPTVLSAAGYRTAHIGKAHFGHSNTPGADPVQLGFDINIGGSHRGNPTSYTSPWLRRPQTYPNLEAHPRGMQITDALTIEANQFIDQAVADEAPFFLHMSHYAIHAPLSGHGHPDFLPAYADRPNPEDDYAALIASMDASLGAILDNLAEEGIAEETLILFIGDNGGLSNRNRNMKDSTTLPDGTVIEYRKDEHNLPLRSGKGSAYEGGIRVPVMVAWAGQEPGASPVQAALPIEPGSRSPVPVISDDFYPTIVAAAGADLPDDYLIDGRDLAPLLRQEGEEFVERPIFFHFPHQWNINLGVGQGIEPHSAIRQGDWKLIYYYGDGVTDGEVYDPRIELFNMVNDIGESENLLADEPERARQMASRLREYLIEAEAGIPISRATNAASELPGEALERD